jgi:hypothetical protein
MEAGRDFRVPTFLSYWNVEVTGLYPLPGDAGAVASPGMGFSRLTDLLSTESIQMFMDVALLDSAMEYWRTREVLGSRLLHLMEVRNAVAHRLLSMPSWDDLDGVQQRMTDRTAYEICRLTCVIYSNAVFFSMFPHSGWHVRLTGRLRWLLSFFPTTCFEDTAMESLILWCNTIGAIASYQTKHFDFFRDSIREVLTKREIHSQEDWIKLCVTFDEFVWSKHACELGVRMIWSNIQTCED